MIMAGGSGTRLWPMSTKEQPKQLIPFIDGRSLLQVALERLEGLVPAERSVVCAGNTHREPICGGLGLEASRFFGEPTGRDTLNAVGLVAYVLHRQDPDAVISVFTADHLITPEDEFRAIVAKGFEVAESTDHALVTFGIAPTYAATGFGYLQLGASLNGNAKVVDVFKEKPDLATAEQYHAAGAEKYLWNSGMFVWKAATLVKAIEQFNPENHAGLTKVAEAWGTPEQEAVLAEVYPTLPKISVDFAVMEPCSTDEAFTVAAVPMPLSWLDVGSWPSFGETREADAQGNVAAECKSVRCTPTRPPFELRCVSLRLSRWAGLQAAVRSGGSECCCGRGSCGLHGCDLDRRLSSMMTPTKRSPSGDKGERCWGDVRGGAEYFGHRPGGVGKLLGRRGTRAGYGKCLSHLDAV